MDVPPEPTEEERFRKILLEEAELCKQSRKYTLLERDRAQITRCGGVGGTKLAKHKKTHNIFLNEQTNIKTDLIVATRKEKVVEDGKKQIRLALLLKESDHHDQVTKLETQQLNEIEYQIDVMKKKIIELAAEQISDQKILERQIRAEKTLEKLENKLEVQVRKTGLIGAENRKLREELSHLLIERNQFNKAWDNLIRNLVNGKTVMMDLIEQATIAYNQREEWCLKLEFLRKKAHADFKAHLQKMQDFQRRKDHHDKIVKYFSVKNQKRVMVKLQQHHEDKLENIREKNLCHLEYYSKVMDDVKKATQKKSVQEIASAFLRQEEENFSKLKFINETNKHLEEMSDVIFKLHEEMDQLQKQNAKWSEEQGKKLENLEEDIKRKKAAADEKEEELKGIDTKLNTIFNQIDTLFKLFNCADDPIAKLLGNHGKIHFYNAHLNLQIIEKNVQEALVTTYRREKPQHQQHPEKKGALTNTVMRFAKSSHYLANLDEFGIKTPCPLCIEHEMVSDIVDELQFACNKEEILEKINARIKLEHIKEIVHSVSSCHLPKSREIIQLRYQ